jgi:hypothetical protein
VNDVLSTPADGANKLTYRHADMKRHEASL